MLCLPSFLPSFPRLFALVILAASTLFEEKAQATPTNETACTALNNPQGSTATCDTNLVVLNFGSPTSGALTIDFTAGDCVDSLFSSLVTNDTTSGRDDDWVVWGTCDDGGSVKDFCCIIEDDGAANPEVTDVGMRGLSTDDSLALIYLGSGFFRDTDMHADLAVWVYGEDGVDWLLGVYASIIPSGTEVPETLRGGGDGDFIQGGDISSTIYGDGGSDYISAGGGNDSIYGGSGFDQIDAGLGADSVLAGSGNDIVCGDIGSCTSGGGACTGFDPTNWVLSCDADADPVGGGADTIKLEDGGTSSSSAFGQSGIDRVYAGLTADLIDGGVGDDELVVNGSDEARGNIGNDDICGASGTDSVLGEEDNDVIVAVSSGALFSDAGSGSDVCFPIAGALNCEAAGSSTCPFTP